MKQQSWFTFITRGISLGLFIIALSSTSIASPNAEGIQVYQKNLHLNPQHKQSLAADIDRYNNADNIWDALRQEFTLPHYENNPRVQEQIEWFMNNQNFLYSSASRAAPYLYYILQQVRKRHLPGEVALLPVFESAFNPFAYSSAGAAGIWQMMPNTATGYGVKQNWWYDGRRDVVASTKAALNYLAYLGNFFDGNWLYAIAAYDTGEGNILAAIKKNVRNGNNTDFWSLPVAQETREYIPKLLALATIMSHPDQYPIELPYVSNAPYLAQVDIGTQIDLKQAAELAGITFKSLKHLNSGFNRATTAPGGPYKLVLPIENVEQFTENLAGTTNYNRPKTPDLSKSILEAEDVKYASSNGDNEKVIKHKPRTLFSFNNTENKSPGRYTMQPGDTLYMVRKGDDLEKIAQHFHTNVKALSSVNNINSQTLAVGAQIIVPTHAPTETDTQKTQISPGDTLYMVRKGDTLEKIAKKYHIAESSLRLANLMGNNYVKEGDPLIIPTRV